MIKEVGKLSQCVRNQGRNKFQEGGVIKLCMLQGDEEKRGGANSRAWMILKRAILVDG